MGQVIRENNVNLVGGEVEFLFAVLSIVLESLCCLRDMSSLAFLALVWLNGYAVREEAFEECD